MPDISGIKENREEGFNKRGFWALMATQFQGAFNDNVYQWVITFYLLGLVHDIPHGSKEYLYLGKFSADTFVPAFATFLFSLPFIIFPAIFGALADRYSKQRVAVATKWLEIFIMAAGGVAFFIGYTPLIWFLLFMMATQSAMFGPAKYGILPEILPPQRLSWGNGVIQMGTMLAIIMGTGLAGPIFLKIEGQVYLVSVLLVILSVSGTCSSYFITRPPAANPSQHIPHNPLSPWQGMMKYFMAIKKDRILFYAVVGYTYFWFVGALARQNLVKFAQTDLMITEDKMSYLLAAIAIGIGLGALAAGYLSRGKVELGLIPLGALGTMVFSLLLALPYSIHQYLLIPVIKSVVVPLTGGEGGFAERLALSSGGHYLLVIPLFLCLGIFAGLYGVPLAAAIQQRAPKGIKGGVIAAVNMLTWVGIAMSSVVFLLLNLLNLSAYHIFIFMGLSALGIGVLQCARSPIMAIRLLWWCLDGTLVRLHVRGRYNIPDAGGALLVGSHETFVDTMAIQAGLDREVFFVIGKDALHTAWIKNLSASMHLVPVDAHSEGDMQSSVENIRKLLASGNLVCVNRSSKMAVNGCVVPWYADYSKLTEGLDVPIVPVSVSRFCEILYAFHDRKIRWYFPGVFRFPIYIGFGSPVSTGASAVQIRNAVQEECSEGYRFRQYRDAVLQDGFMRVARRFPWRVSFADMMTGRLSYFKTLVGVIVLARKLKPIIGSNDKIGVLMPSTTGGALANIALQTLGNIPVNLNYTASSEIIADCAERCGITHTVTAKAFLERVPVIPPGIPIYLDEIKENVTGRDRAVAIILALLAPKWLLKHLLGASSKKETDIATIIFSSGSEGIPKGVMLTHRNILTVVEGMREMVPHDKRTGVVGFLPFFHSFGFSVALWTPLMEGIHAILHPNPLEPKPIAQLVKKHNGTVMIATPTFLQGFIRRCEPDQLDSLECVVAGAEKLPDRIRDAFKEKFGIEPLEGYGATECAPVVAVNLPDEDSPGFFVPHTKRGSIGHPFPYQQVKIVDPETGVELPTGEAGMMLVKGENVMSGYLNDEIRTISVLKDGWYSTGDIAAVDEDGFIFITDRLARFSKIGGEMIPHTRIEECLHQLLQLTEQSLVVTGVPDETRGERLVVLHVLEENQLALLKSRVNESNLPNLWRPRATAYYAIPEIPVLGTGKIDIKKVKALAIELARE